MRIDVVGAGLAGCEAAYQIAKRGVDVRLYEMKPMKYSPAHSYPGFAELVCSNSLRSDRTENAVGLLKEEMRLMDSLIMRAADATSVPAGGALAVNRKDFSDYVTDAVKSDGRIEVVNGEYEKIDPQDGWTIIATGPLTSERLSEEVMRVTGRGQLFFYDAAAPIVTAESIDFSRAFYASRYGRGTDYLNCPMNEQEYAAFYSELVNASCAGEKDFEKNIFEGCMPVEVMAGRGTSTLLFGPLKPVGLTDPRTGKTPYAVVQLRKEDSEGRLFNLVGFQTHLKFPEQKRVFSMIPGLEHAEFVRYGVMHRNTYIKSPGVLDGTYALVNDRRIRFAGQMTGVEGYVESAASGLLCGIYAARELKGDMRRLTRGTATGALAAYISSSQSADFQPMNVNFGIMDTPREKNKKKRTQMICGRALEEIRSFIDET